jgi:carboxymethylenebutenolidase
MEDLQVVSYPFGTEQRPGYLALPTGEPPFAGIVVIHEIAGLNENIADTARRLFDLGYAALAVDLFAGRNRIVCLARFYSSLIANRLNSRSVRELKAALAYLAGRPEVDGARLGALGFCLGGNYALAWACTDNRLQAIAAFYAVNPSPLSAIARACPVVGSYPQDFTTRHGRKLDRALDRYGVPHDIKFYPDAQHSFFNDRGPHYEAHDAADAWQRVRAFFDLHVRGTGT